MRRLTLLLALATPALADIITLKDGRKIEGEIIQEDATVLKLKVKSGAMSFDPKDIASIDRTPTPEQEYKARAAKVDAKSAPAQLELGKWACSKGLAVECVRHCMNAWTLDNASAEAIAELQKHQWQLVDGKWVDPDTYFEAKGYTKLNGKWLAPLEYECALAHDEVLRLMDEKKAAEKGVFAAKAKRKAYDDQVANDKRRQGLLGEEIVEATTKRDSARETVQAADAATAKAKGELATLEAAPPDSKDPGKNKSAIASQKKKITALEAAARKLRPPYEAAEKALFALQTEKKAIIDRESGQKGNLAALDKEVDDAEKLVVVAGENVKAGLVKEAEAKAKWDASSGK